jgi:chemotaxis protein histidine kinase CheA
MSSRALRKAQREREEQERLQKPRQEEEEEEEEDDDVLPAQPAKKSAFAMLLEEDDDDDDDAGGPALDEEEDEEPTAPAEAATPAPKSGKKKRRRKKKAKSETGTPKEAEPEEELDEIDKALKQLSTNRNAAPSGSTSAGVDGTVDEANRLLAVNTAHLHAQHEMRRLFGRAALDRPDDGGPANAGGNRRQQRRVQQAGLNEALRGQGGRGGGLGSLALRRNIFMQGKEEWPVASAGGLAMEVEHKRADGTVLYRFTHNRAYQGVQGQFQVCVESMDPNRLILLLRHNPYHISTLLQVSEIAKQERDHATAGDLLERALFAFGKVVHSTFAKNLAEGKARLDFARPENRELWLASWRYMQNLAMRATWRTVYEWAKLLLSLSPEHDPYAIWLLLDQYALRSRQDLDYLNISRNPTFQTVHQDMPHVKLSQALAECRAGNRNKGQQALFTAVGRFPWVVARLMRELGIDPPPAVWGKEPRTEKEKLHAELYATRAKDLWNTPEVSALLAEIASAVPPDTPSAEPDTGRISLPEARHVLLSDEPALIALLPRSYTSRLTSVSDPLPPEGNKPSYTTLAAPSDNADRAGSVEGLVAGGRFTEILGQLQEFENLHRWFADIFPWFQATEDPTAVPPALDGEAAAADAAEHAAALEASGEADIGGEARPSAEDIERAMREHGVSAEDVRVRGERLRELRGILGNVVGWVRHAYEDADEREIYWPGEGEPPQDGLGTMTWGEQDEAEYMAELESMGRFAYVEDGGEDEEEED